MYKVQKPLCTKTLILVGLLSHVVPGSTLLLSRDSYSHWNLG